MRDSQVDWALRSGSSWLCYSNCMLSVGDLKSNEMIQRRVKKIKELWPWKIDWAINWYLIYRHRIWFPLRYETWRWIHTVINDIHIGVYTIIITYLIWLYFLRLCADFMKMRLMTWQRNQKIYVHIQYTSAVAMQTIRWYTKMFNNRPIQQNLAVKY